MNSLVKSCLSVARAGYTKEDVIRLEWHNDELLKLGNYLLNGSKLGKKFRLKNVRDGHNDIAIMFGAGIDSWCAIEHAKAHHAFAKTVVIHVDYGQPYAKQELEVVAKLKDIPVHRVQIELANPGQQTEWKEYIFPARNLVLASIGSQYADDVWIVATQRKNEEVGTPDKTGKFFREASGTFSKFYGRSVAVRSPFMNKTKSQVVQTYLDQGGKIEDLLSTFSCYRSDGKMTEPRHCGWCYACFKRYNLFQSRNVEHSFEKVPWEGPNWNTYKAAEAAKGRE